MRPLGFRGLSQLRGLCICFRHLCTFSLSPNLEERNLPRMKMLVFSGGTLSSPGILLCAAVYLCLWLPGKGLFDLIVRCPDC